MKAEIKTGAKIGLSFDQGQIQHKIYGSAEAKGTIPLLLPYGTYNMPSIAKDLPRLEETIRRLTVEHRDLWENELDDALARKMRDYLLFGAYVNPEDDALTPKMECFIALVILIFAIDDLLDSLNEMSEDNLKYEDMKKYTQFLVKLFNGEYKSADEVSNPMPAIQCTNHYCVRFIKMCEAALPGFLQKNYYLRQEWVNSVCGWVVVMERNAKKFSDTSQIMFGSCISGLIPALEFVALVRGLSICEEVRQDILFQRIKHAYGSASHLMNDVIGLERDVRLDQVRDSTILLSVVQDGVPLQTAFDRAFNQLCAEINDVKTAGALLRECYWDDEDLHELLNCMERAIDGQLYWYEQTTRYGNINLHVVEVKGD